MSTRQQSFAVFKGLTVAGCYSFWVCEKSDGIRVLLFVNTIITTNAQTVYLVSSQLKIWSFKQLTWVV
jgi:hypothetical protein